MTLFAERYRMEKELGRGSFGVVFLARDAKLSDRAVAIKILHPALNSDPVVIRRFQQEAGILARLEHDNIVPVYDVGSDGDRRYIVMRYIPGRTLDRLLAEEGPQTPERVFAWLRQMAAGLDYAHGRGILHRDLKPGNLLLDEERERVMISDFGLAKAVQVSGGSSISQSHAEMTGTAYYMAPEVIRGQEPSRASDLYSLGCLLYELLSGRPPYTGSNAIAVTAQHVLEPAPQLTLEGGLGAALAKQVAALMAKEPEARPGSAGEVVAHIETALRDQHTGVSVGARGEAGARTQKGKSAAAISKKDKAIGILLVVLGWALGLVGGFGVLIILSGVVGIGETIGSTLGLVLGGAIAGWASLLAIRRYWPVDAEKMTWWTLIVLTVTWMLLGMLGGGAGFGFGGLIVGWLLTFAARKNAWMQKKKQRWRALGFWALAWGLGALTGFFGGFWMIGGPVAGAIFGFWLFRQMMLRRKENAQKVEDATS